MKVPFPTQSSLKQTLHEAEQLRSILERRREEERLSQEKAKKEKAIRDGLSLLERMAPFIVEAAKACKNQYKILTLQHDEFNFPCFVANAYDIKDVSSQRVQYIYTYLVDKGFQPFFTSRIDGGYTYYDLWIKW